MKNEKNIFEIALRGRYRFNYKGSINVEDLWQLSVNELDIIFKDLNSQLKQTKEESLLEIKTEKNTELDTKVEIIKYIVQVKLEEEQLRLKAKTNREKKQKILELINKKDNEEFEEMSKEDLQKLYNEIDK